MAINSRHKTTVLAAVRAGLPLKEAMALCQRNSDNFFERATPDEKDAFMVLVNQKQAEYMLDNITQISKKAKSESDAKLACWLLERGFPAYFSGKVALSEGADTKMQKSIDAIMGAVGKKD